ncbi:MAG: polysaccharide deacetylase [Clostridia bacterium]|nr:polysaccharide deacetylase [Clostridia bacterium]
MIYDFMEVTPKLNRKKVIIAIIIASVIVMAIGGAIFYWRLSKQPNHAVEENDNIALEQNNTENKKQKHVASVNFSPVFSEQAKARLANIYHSEEKTVYLTFDDGPSKTVTPLILDLLKRENIKASFFVLGSRVELNPNIVKREYEEGHFIANHGYSHIYSNIYSNVEAVLGEYNKTQQAIQNALGIEYNGHLFRFPGGSTGGKYHNTKNEAKGVLQANQIGYIDWNALSSDAAGAKTKEALLENVKETVGQKKTVVILMHDAGDKILTYEVLPEVIAYLREQGYVFKNFYDIMD